MDPLRAEPLDTSQDSSGGPALLQTLPWPHAGQLIFPSAPPRCRPLCPEPQSSSPGNPACNRGEREALAEYPTGGRDPGQPVTLPEPVRGVTATHRSRQGLRRGREAGSSGDRNRNWRQLGVGMGSGSRVSHDLNFFFSYAAGSEVGSSKEDQILELHKKLMTRVHDKCCHRSSKEHRASKDG